MTDSPHNAGSPATNSGTQDNEASSLRANRLATIRDLTHIPFASIHDELPAGMQELYAEVHDGQALVPGLKMGVGALVVQRWDPAYAASGWTLYGADLTLDMGHPFGALFYRNDEDGRVLRVGVQWHPPVQRLDFPALHPSKPELSSDCSEHEVDAVVLDARSRIGVLVATNALIGSWVATTESEDAILDASGLGLQRIAEAPEADADA